ncbi:nuclear transport factor 2 family protein [Sphingorhabdus sp. Alg231-15]|uniref:nuclear transport factor 2 family protein n=1 Tax=Sphingorhabdus sp. Alg231-15 TaxID=1922222 RepID=UPI00307C8807
MRRMIAYLGAILLGCTASAATPLKQQSITMDQQKFEQLLSKVSDGWNAKNTELALNAFADDALYTEPPDRQIYQGTEELRIFFDRITPGATMIWQNIWFNSDTGYGSGEYSFKNGGRKTAVHGVAVIKLEHGKIKIWREYQQRGDISFESFHNPKDKNWQTTVDDL